MMCMRMHCNTRAASAWLWDGFSPARIMSIRSVPLSPATPSESEDWAPVVMDRARTRRVIHGGEAWRLWVDSPSTPSSGGLPVIWVLDGAELFPLVSATVRRLSNRPSATGVGPAVVIGLDRDPVDRDRRYADGSPWPSDDPDFSGRAHGGAEALLDILTGPALEAAAAIAPLDRSRQMLLGHSFMAYLVLYALSARPEAFRMFGAVSPSIWWNESRLWAALQAASDRGQRAFIAVGECEEPATARTPDDQRRQARRVVARARQAAAILEDRLGGRCVFHAAAGEDHGSILPAVLPRLLRFAFMDTQNSGDNGR